ncbi:tRNA (adenosine(37)-N6)-threonylcarbamoyltransferase complex dimerization subunit type 1 TsaB [Candidatus Pantoea edessiphila]|uniref:tRNA threonylcarbamoyladenosine biosynthesis protein TsaB n=1 Tax=Candidatus Pantoea edessiphila TaxID=2044610 RepID=A0A2P5SWP9_9GAMM|nr:tRNA (adenosine(37)-N6)-threonylcarbamoyltransferase complex dimerization subunit type 1 TsaB [Candidatus Pantoea edessiphila]PPI86767.1 tRNA (adenosine(37)-N6)-threonylcarbamoyltransferase complex dimerization subunit type 1 TsaB [Candidatus Pantoea edessiphila]
MSIQILAINTATEKCSVSVLAQYNNEKIIHNCFEITKRNSSAYVLSLIDKVLKISKISLIDINVIAFSIGPGSFTGIRIGINVAQGLSFGRSIKIVGISTLENLAQGAFRYQGATRVLTAINARMNEIYWAEYQLNDNGIWFMHDKEKILSPVDAIKRMNYLNGKWTVAGDAWNVYPDLYKGHSLVLNPCAYSLPSSEDMIPLTKVAMRKDSFIQLEQINPVYLRNQIISN